MLYKNQHHNTNATVIKKIIVKKTTATATMKNTRGKKNVDVEEVGILTNSIHFDLSCGNHIIKVI